MDLLKAKEERLNMEKVQVRFAKVKEGAIIPSRRDEDAGFDIYPCFDEKYIVIEPHQTRLIATGLASAFESGWVIKLMERGSTGTKGIGQRCGVIDSGYRNEWFVPLTNHNDVPLVIAKKDVQPNIKGDFILYSYEKAICQALLLPVPKVNIEEIQYEDLLAIESERGLGALGSSGK